MQTLAVHVDPAGHALPQSPQCCASFTMSTQADEKGKPGVVAGTHRVRLNADESASRFVSPKFLSHETSGITVNVPTEGELVIKVWK